MPAASPLDSPQRTETSIIPLCPVMQQLSETSDGVGFWWYLYLNDNVVSWFVFRIPYLVSEFHSLLFRLVAEPAATFNKLVWSLPYTGNRIHFPALIWLIMFWHVIFHYTPNSASIITVTRVPVKVEKIIDLLFLK